MTNEEAKRALHEIEKHCADYPSLTEADWVTIASAIRHLTYYGEALKTIKRMLEIVEGRKRENMITRNLGSPIRYEEDKDILEAFEKLIEDEDNYILEIVKKME